MTLLVMGATAAALRRVRDLAPSGLHITDDPRSAPDWVVVATRDQRARAIAEHGLTPFRVVEMPSLASDENAAQSSESMRASLIKMAEIGASRPLISTIGVALVRPFIRRWIDAGPERAADVIDTPDTGLFVSSVPGRIPSGQQLDTLLAARARERAKRFAALAVHPTADRTS